MIGKSRVSKGLLLSLLAVPFCAGVQLTCKPAHAALSQGANAPDFTLHGALAGKPILFLLKRPSLKARSCFIFSQRPLHRAARRKRMILQMRLTSFSQKALPLLG